MVTESFRYDLAGMATAHADIVAAAARLNQTHADVVALMNRLRKTWQEGSAVAAWHSYQKEWNTIFADVHNELASLGAAVDQARQNAHSAETANGSMCPS